MGDTTHGYAGADTMVSRKLREGGAHATRRREARIGGVAPTSTPHNQAQAASRRSVDCAREVACSVPSAEPRRWCIEHR